MIEEGSLKNVKQIGMEIHTNGGRYREFWRVLRSLEKEGFMKWDIEHNTFKIYSHDSKAFKRFCCSNVWYINSRFIDFKRYEHLCVMNVKRENLLFTLHLKRWSTTLWSLFRWQTIAWFFLVISNHLKQLHQGIILFLKVDNTWCWKLCHFLRQRAHFTSNLL